MHDRRLQILLLVSVFIIATCGLIYELIAGTLASYLLGDSVTQFSTVIGTYLFAMGIGSYLSKFVDRNLITTFIKVELIIGLIGGWSAAGLFLLFTQVSSFRVLLYSTVLIIGTLVGLEIPLLMRILKGRLEFKDLVSKVFTFDYIGALLASLIFPLVLVPRLGLVRSSLLFGIINVLVGLATAHLLKRDIPSIRLLNGTAILILVTQVAGFVWSDHLIAWSEKAAYNDEVVYAKSSHYQRIVLTRSGSDLRLYLNGNLQFSSRDEYRYHEALVHPALSRLNGRANVLVLGGGDGMAIREILKYPAVSSITLVDLDPEITRLFATQPLLTNLNHASLNSSKVQIINQDAFTWLKANQRKFDLIVADFPDPSNFSLGKLYSTAFYSRIQQALAPHGAFVVQSTSPYVARRSFWCINETLIASGFVTEPYHLYIPSFGEWGFIIASHSPIPARPSLPDELRYITEATMRELFHFPPDMGKVQTEVNRLNNQILVRYFEEEWANYVH